MFVQIAEHSAEAFNAAARTQKCLQLAAGAVYTTPLEEASPAKTKAWAHVHDEKIDALASIVEEAAGGAIIVCYEFKSDLARLTAAFPQGRALKTAEDEDAFKAGKVPILFLHPASAGHGLDGFQRVCNTIVFFSVNWNLELYLQVIERVGPVRQMQAGLERPVFVHRILARDTVDELVLERLDQKRAVQDILLDATKRRRW
jgi:hypothetical protein